MMKRFKLLTVLSLTIVGSAQGAMVIYNPEPELHHRFKNDADFILEGFDLSGVARANTGGRWATMISPTHYLTATHSKPAIGSILTFHVDNDPTGITSTRTVISGEQVKGSDLWIGEINIPVDPNIKIYEIAGLGTFLGDTAYQVGIGTKYGTTNTTGMSVGRNVLDQDFGEVKVNNRPTQAVGYLNDAPSGDLTGANLPGPTLQDPGETYYQGGDSGGPTFLIQDDELLLFGIHSFIAEISLDLPHDTFERRGSGDIFLPFYRQTVLASIPEPSPIYALTIGAFLAVGWRYFDRKSYKANGR